MVTLADLKARSEARAAELVRRARVEVERKAADTAAAFAIVADALAELPVEYRPALDLQFEHSVQAMSTGKCQSWTFALGLRPPTMEQIARSVVADVRQRLAAGRLARIVHEPTGCP